MSVQWLISSNDGAPVLFSDLGVTSCVVTLVANGEDSMTFTVDADYSSDPDFTDGTKIAVIRRSGSDVCVFVGWVRGIPRAAHVDSEDISYYVQGPSSMLRRVTFAQGWTVISENDGTPTTAFEPRVVLGENSSGTRRTTGGTITDVINYAILVGKPIALGTVGIGVLAPREEHDNISCIDAILSCLRWTPTSVLWWDYNHQEAGVYSPAANVTSASEMTAVNLVLHSADTSDSLFTPRYDLQVPGIVITYRITGEREGKPYERRAYDTAGDADDAEKFSIYINLEGARYELLTQKVVTGDYPTDNATARTWLASMVPWIAALPAGDWSTISSTRSEAYHYPRYLVEGGISEWMGVAAVKETTTVKVRVKTRDENDNITEDSTRDVPITLISTNAFTKTYSKNILAASGESVPEGLAAALFAEWSRLHWEGSFMLDEDEPTFSIRPGVVLNATGARSEWASMNAVVQSVSVNIATGSTSLTTGPCARLEADSRMALFRAVRTRRNPVLSSHTDGEITAISGTDTSAAQDTSAPQSNRHHRLAIRVGSISDNALLHSIELYPESVTFSKSSEASAQEIKPREIRILNAKNKVVKVQAIAGAEYGEETDPTETPPGTPPPCGHPGNQPGAGTGTPDDDSSSVDNDHPGDKAGEGYDADHPGDSSGDNGITPNSSGDCQ